MKILIADDDADARATITEFLSRQGHDVVSATNGLEALLQVKQNRPHAVVLDLHMPRLGGLEALKRIRAFDPKIQVVIVTAEMDEAVHRDASALGARAVLPKPVVPSALLAAFGATPSAPTEPAVEPQAAPAPQAGGERKGIRVLLIDDDDAVRGVLADFLTLRGYDVSQAARAAAGTTAIADRMPDVVLLDIDMPGLSGADALPTIRAMAPKAVVIMISGTDDEAIAKRTLAFGAFDYLVKPIDFDYLEQSLASALAMKTLEP